MTKHVVATLREAEEKIEKQRPFRLRGWTDGVPTLSAGPWVTDSFGELPVNYHEDVNTAHYVVWSYDTPIAWVRTDGTRVLPDVGYSATTGQHQYTVKAAWDITGRLKFPARDREVRPAGGGPRRGGIDDL
jgi:hypothetical protein